MSAKIVVVKFKELIKNIALIVIGIIVLGLLIMLFIPKNKSQAEYNAGTYSAEIILHNSPVRVDVTVNEHEITDIKMTQLAETQEVFYPLLEPTAQELAEEIIKKQSLDIETSVDKSMTSEILLQAVGVALSKAETSTQPNTKSKTNQNSSQNQTPTQQTTTEVQVD